MEKINSQLALKTSGIQHGSVTPAYCSNAYSCFPTYPMQKKHWFGADLILIFMQSICTFQVNSVIHTSSAQDAAKSQVPNLKYVKSCKSKSLNQTSILTTRFETYQRLISYISHLKTADILIRKIYHICTNHDFENQHV
ncbi:MAG: hypothetical protein DLM72_00415 [Candidatus Nitrosopolaris wilkensis]|nr:MAG: hypothetical protein DLM72_00415 [Candidatus Nitrosopolaris wilkensis]